MEVKYRGFRGNVVWDGDSKRMRIRAVEENSGAVLTCESKHLVGPECIFEKFQALVDKIYDVVGEEGMEVEQNND